MLLDFVYTMVQKSQKKDQKLKSRGPALNLKARVSSFIVSVAGLQLKHN